MHKYAIKYFGLPANHDPYIQDAITFVESHRDDQSGKYDFIIHDVFTGGAEPLELFTAEFIAGLANLLRDDGAIAIVSLSNNMGTYLINFRTMPEI